MIRCINVGKRRWHVRTALAVVAFVGATAVSAVPAQAAFCSKYVAIAPTTLYFKYDSVLGVVSWPSTWSSVGGSYIRDSAVGTHSSYFFEKRFNTSSPANLTMAGVLDVGQQSVTAGWLEVTASC